MSNPRTPEEIQTAIDELADKFDAEEISDVKEFKRQMRELNSEMASAKSAHEMYEIQSKITQERNRRVFDEVARKNYGVTISEADKSENGGGMAFRYFRDKIMANPAMLNKASADGDEKLLEYFSAVAEIVNKETGHDPDKPKDAKAKETKKEEEAKPEEAQVDNPEPTDISALPESTEQTVSGDEETPGEKAFKRLLKGEEISEFDHATIARDLEFNEVSFKDAGLPINEMASVYSKLQR